MTRTHDGCRSVTTHVDADDSRRILLVQEWNSRVEQQAHIGWRDSTGDLATLLGSLEEPPITR